MRRAWLGVLLLALVPVASAGTLYWTPEVLEDTGIATEECHHVRTHATALEAPEDDGRAYWGTSYAAIGCPQLFEHTSAHDVQLSGDATYRFYFSCERPIAIGHPGLDIGFRATLLHNDEAVSSEEFGGPASCSGPSDVHEMEVVLKTNDIQVEAGDVLRVRHVLWYSNLDASLEPNAHIRTGAAFPSGLAVEGLLPEPEPDAPEPPAEVWDQFEGEALSVNHTWQTPRNATHHVNWTTYEGPWNVSIEAQVEEGNATVRVLDGEGTTVVNERLNQTGDVSLRLEAAAIGAWRATIEYEEFTGTLRLDIRPEATEETPAPTPPTPTQTPEDERTPLPMALALLALAGLAWTRRR